MDRKIADVLLVQPSCSVPPLTNPWLHQDKPSIISFCSCRILARRGVRTTCLFLVCFSSLLWLFFILSTLREEIRPWPGLLVSARSWFHWLLSLECLTCLWLLEEVSQNFSTTKWLFLLNSPVFIPLSAPLRRKTDKEILCSSTGWSLAKGAWGNWNQKSPKLRNQSLNSTGCIWSTQ